MGNAYLSDENLHGFEVLYNKQSFSLVFYNKNWAIRSLADKKTTLNVIKFQTLFSFCSQIKYWYLGLEFTNCLSKLQTEKTLIRLSDQGLSCLSRSIWQVTGVRNFM